MPDDHIVNFRRLIDRQLVAEHGDLLRPQGAGRGWNLDVDAVNRYGGRYPGEEGIGCAVR